MGLVPSSKERPPAPGSGQWGAQVLAPVSWAPLYPDLPTGRMRPCGVSGPRRSPVSAANSGLEGGRLFLLLPGPRAARKDSLGCRAGPPAGTEQLRTQGSGGRPSSPPTPDPRRAGCLLLPPPGGAPGPRPTAGRSHGAAVPSSGPCGHVPARCQLTAEGFAPHCHPRCLPAAPGSRPTPQTAFSSGALWAPRWHERRKEQPRGLEAGRGRWQGGREEGEGEQNGGWGRGMGTQGKRDVVRGETQKK